MKLARLLALLIPATLLAGAWAFQLIGHLVPCEMCHWQRWPLYAALVPAILAFAPGLRPPVIRLLIALAALGIIASGVIGFYHMGVEYKWWLGPTHCTSQGLPHGGDILKALLAQPLVLCDKPQWTLFGISLAGFNALISIPGGLLTLFLAAKGRS
ncbi:disulfide bond formation protein DsbB [Sphingomonas vulcanisoli]|uniref:Disulfide bond formation protein DsbB n=1 Tax=Sphingomonas vulcanisoli TaxID=1658060 RepID=A0ABX0TPN1_9SPHN|nr:disulfide bond formation protein DsbB [Sphingomonas vulcanisoli]